MRISVWDLSKGLLAICFLNLPFSSTSIGAAPPEIETTFESYRDAAGEVMRLANENQQPFVYAGITIKSTNQEQPNMEDIQQKYLPSIDRFLTVKHCLFQAEESLPQPDLTHFNWNEIKTNEDAEVCIHRIASSYSTPEHMKTWFESQGFQTQDIQRREGMVGLSASWSIDDKGARFGSSFLNKAWIGFVAYSMSVGVVYDTNQSVQSVDVILNIL
jgi:hypothetical protein